MVWTNLDDQYPHSLPMTELADIAALGFDVCGVIYCNRLLTDGFIPDGALNQVYPPLRNPRRLANKLVEQRLWERDDEAGGYRIVGFLERHPSREEVEAKRRKRAEAGRVGGRRSGETRRSRDEANASGLLEPSPPPTSPSPSVVSTSSPPPRALQLSLGDGGGGEIERTLETMRAEGIPDDVAAEAVEKARLRAVDGKVWAFTPYALQRARNLMAERQKTVAARLDPKRVQERAFVAALQSGDLDDFCDHQVSLSECDGAECIARRIEIVAVHAKRVLEEAQGS